MDAARPGFFLDIVEAAIDYRIERIELALEFSRRRGFAAIAARPVIAAALARRTLARAVAVLAGRARSRTAAAARVSGHTRPVRRARLARAALTSICRPR